MTVQEMYEFCRKMIAANKGYYKFYVCPERLGLNRVVDVKEAARKCCVREEVNEGREDFVLVLLQVEKG